MSQISLYSDVSFRFMLDSTTLVDFCNCSRLYEINDTKHNSLHLNINYASLKLQVVPLAVALAPNNIS